MHVTPACIEIVQLHMEIKSKCTLISYVDCGKNTFTTLNYVLYFSIRFQLGANITHEMAEQMKKFVMGISDVEVKYRLASHLGFRDVIESLLNGPELPYLKDTVWQSGFSRQHNYLQ